LLPFNGTCNIYDHFGNKVQRCIPHLIKPIEHLIERVFDQVRAELIQHEVLDELLLAVGVAAVVTLL
jgi:hypothetical protein